MDLFVDGEWMLTCVIFILLKIVRLLP